MAQKNAVMQQWVALLATVFVVGGMVAVVLTRPGAGEPGNGALVATDAALSGRVVVYADQEALHVVDAEEGAVLRECALPDGAQVEAVTPQGMVVSMASGDRVRMGFDCTAEAMERAVRVTEPDEDAVSGVVFADGTDVALVATNGRPFREAELVGWMDDTRVGLVAFRGDVRYALAAEVDGTLAVLTALPEIVDGFAVGDGSFWYVTATPGEGIEFGPTGPSAIHRVRMDDGGRTGTDTVVVEEPTALIESLRVGYDGLYAYTVGGTLMVGREKALVNAGTGTPVGWTDDGRALVMDRARALSFRAVTGEATETGVVLPEGVFDAWSVGLDASGQTE